jgi:hypothetical protein
MTFPCVIIARHKPGLYEWAIVYDQQKMAGDLGDISVKDCLISAIGSLPPEERLVEIRYRGVHMGTYDKLRVGDCLGEIAAIIVERHGELTHEA